MPINIYKRGPGDTTETIAYLCGDEWLLWPQIAALSDWLEQRAYTLVPGDYVADLGFRWRADVSVGGPVLAPATTRCMAALGMSLYLSEFCPISKEV